MADRAHAAMELDTQATRIGVDLAIVERRQRHERVRQSRAAQAWRSKMRVPERKIGDEGNHSALAVQRVVMLSARPSAGRRGEIAGRETWHDLGGQFDMTCGVHAERCEDPLVKEIAQRLSADLLDDASEQHEIRVAVEIAR